MADVTPDVNYDESKVRQYVLPDPLTRRDGTRVANAAGWRERRTELLDLFARHVYGRTPLDAITVRHELMESSSDALGGAAIRKQVALHIGDAADGPVVHLLIYLPARSTGPAPVFVGLNFHGNHTTQPDPAIVLPTSWVRDAPTTEAAGNRATEAGRGKAASRWPVEQILSAGFGVATAYYGDLDPDYHDGFANGVHPLFPRTGGDDDWGAIGAWAWGLSRIMDYLETDPQVDASRVIVTGHSRLGKSALWAGAQDERFAAVISNQSGCGGAALNRRNYGETIARITTVFPHWFCPKYASWAERETEMPIDQHELLALIAPRPLLVCSAVEDRWADPRGEFLSVYHAGPVYRLLGRTAPSSDAMPDVEQPPETTAAYNIRPGKHDVNPADWAVMIRFVQRWLPR